MNGLEDEFGNEINFYRLDANDPSIQRVQNELQLRGHPTVALLNLEGTVSQRLYGVQAEEQLRPLLAELLAQN